MAQSRTSSGPIGYAAYESRVIDGLWRYAKTSLINGRDLLDSSERRGVRPPVLRKHAVEHNLLYPPDANDELRKRILDTLPAKSRHRYFESLRSSQALAQSVFGGLKCLNKLESLRGLADDTGLPAFAGDLSGANPILEYEVDCLGEPRRTSVDVWFDLGTRIAVECKFTEADFGRCSRPELREGRDSNFEKDYCDGSYSRQRGRSSRCALTEIGVEYWRYVPDLSNWRAETDLATCPIRFTYQIVRNLLAACVRPDGTVVPDGGYALVIYDARNPAFQSGGPADGQWRKAKESLKRPECLRRCSWQSLAAHLARDSDLDWLNAGLASKYGIMPALR